MDGYPSSVSEVSMAWNFNVFVWYGDILYIRRNYPPFSAEIPGHIPVKCASKYMPEYAVYLPGRPHGYVVFEIAGSVS